MGEVQIFSSSEFGKVRTVTINGEPWFVGKDVAVALGYEKPTDAARKRVDDEDKGVSKIETPSGAQTMNIINESGLYALIFSSKLPSAKRFKHWVTSEVLPSIRRTGSYGVQMDQLVKITEQLAQAAVLVTQAAAQITQSMGRIAEVAEKIADAADRLTSAADRLTAACSGKEPVPRGLVYMDSSCAGRCKLETFPEEITGQVDEMLENMVQQQNLNFSMIARFCTINGYSISSPSVKTYFQKHFTNG